MQNLPEGFSVNRIYCFPYRLQSGEEMIGYIPGAPRLEVRQGTAQASLLSSPKGAVLSVQGIWRAEPGDLQALEAEIESRYPSIDDPTPELAELSNIMASLVVTGMDGASVTFGPKRTSGSSSFRVVFNENLMSSEKLAVVEAFAGKTGVLSLVYEGDLEVQQTVSLEMVGDMAEDLRILARHKPDLRVCEDAVRSALKAGRLKLKGDENAGIPGEPSSRIERSLRSLVAKHLYDTLLRMGSDAASMTSFAIRQKASDSAQRTFHIRSEADLGESFAGQDATDLITEVDADLPEPPR